MIAESEAEIRANARILQDYIDADNARINKEADRIYNEKKFGTHSSSAEPKEEPSGNHRKSNDSWEDSVEQFKYTISLVLSVAFLCFVIVIFHFIYENIVSNNRGGLDRLTWESYTDYKKIFFQNKNKFKGAIDLKEYYKLVVEYNLCSHTERESEIADVFTERNWGKPFLKEFKRKPFKSEKAESNRKRIEQMKLLFLPCPECLTDIDCNNAKERTIYICHGCAIYYKFRNDVGLIKC